MSDELVCGDCQRAIGDDDFATEVNPEGGHGRPQLLICDDCMAKPKWEHWRAEHWPEWPRKDHE